MFNKLLVPLDGSHQSAHVIEPASRVATPGTAIVHLLCIVDASYLLTQDAESDVKSEGLIFPFAEAQTSFAQSILTAAASQLADRNLTVKSTCAQEIDPPTSSSNKQICCPQISS